MRTTSLASIAQFSRFSAISSAQSEILRFSFELVGTDFSSIVLPILHNLVDLWCCVFSPQSQLLVSPTNLPTSSSDLKEVILKMNTLAIKFWWLNSHEIRKSHFVLFFLFFYSERTSKIPSLIFVSLCLRGLHYHTETWNVLVIAKPTCGFKIEMSISKIEQ